MLVRPCKFNRVDSSVDNFSNNQPTGCWHGMLLLLGPARTSIGSK